MLLTWSRCRLIPRTELASPRKTLVMEAPFMQNCMLKVGIFIKAKLCHWGFALELCELYQNSGSLEPVSQKRTTAFNPLSSNPTKWSNTLKQFVGNLPTNCMTLFECFVKLALKGLNFEQISWPLYFYRIFFSSCP